MSDDTPPPVGEEYVRESARCRAAGHGYPCCGAGYCYFCAWRCSPTEGPTLCGTCGGPACPRCGCEHSNVVECVHLTEVEKNPCGALCGCAHVDRVAELADRLHGVMRVLDLVVRYDALRPEGSPRWTVALPGVSRGDGNTPEEAAMALRRSLDTISAAAALRVLGGGS